MEQRPRYGVHRPYMVVNRLSDLVGPRHGVLELPLRMDWSQQRRYDLDRDGDRRLLYETVLNEALHPEDLHGVLNGKLLVDLWPSPWLPRRIRELWESRFPELSARRVA